MTKLNLELAQLLFIELALHPGSVVFGHPFASLSRLTGRRISITSN
jgi:hypothetical protein